MIRATIEIAAELGAIVLFTLAVFVCIGLYLGVIV